MIFLSYSHEDVQAANEIESVLGGKGLSVFRDVNDINWGQSIRRRVHEGMQQAEAVILLISPASQKSQWVAYEVGFASAHEKPVLPFLTHPSLNLPPFLDGVVHLKSIEEVQNKVDDSFLSNLKNSFGHSSTFGYESISDQEFLKAVKYMPELLKTFWDDLQSDQFVREFFVIPNRQVRLGGSEKKRWIYYEEDYSNLLNKLSILEEFGFIEDVSIGNAPIYRMTDDFIQMLLKNYRDQKSNDSTMQSQKGHELDDIQKKILLHFFHAQDRVVAKDVAASINLDVGTTQYHFDELAKKQFIRLVGGSPANPLTGKPGYVWYKITEDGRKHVVEVIGT